MSHNGLAIFKLIISTCGYQRMCIEIQVLSMGDLPMAVIPLNTIEWLFISTDTYYFKPWIYYNLFIHSTIDEYFVFLTF